MSRTNRRTRRVLCAVAVTFALVETAAFLTVGIRPALAIGACVTFLAALVGLLLAIGPWAEARQNRRVSDARAAVSWRMARATLGRPVGRNPEPRPTGRRRRGRPRHRYIPQAGTRRLDAANSG